MNEEEKTTATGTAEEVKSEEVKEVDAKYLHNAQKQCYFFYELYLYDSCYSDFSAVKYN